MVTAATPLVRQWMRSLAWPGAVAAAILASVAPVLFGSATLAHRDTGVLYGPLRELVSVALRAGRLPLWNPHEFAGKPLFAEGIHSVLHPLSILAALLSLGVDGLAIAYLLSAGLGAYALARSLDASGPAAAAAGAAFGLSGFVASMTGNLVFLAGASSLPWMLAGARLSGSGAPRGLVAGALGTALAFLSGDVQVALIGVALGVALAAGAGGRGGVVRTGLAMAAGLALAGVQVVASWVEFQNTDRSTALSVDDAMRWPLVPARVLEWFAPGLFGLDDATKTAPVFLALSEKPDLPIPFSDSVYLGAVLIFLAALGVRRRTGALLGGSVVALAWLAMGQHLGGAQVSRLIPLWSAFRYPEKLMGPIALCVACLGALGLDDVGMKGASERVRRTAVVLAGALAVVVLMLALAPDASAAALGNLGFGRSARFAVEALRKGVLHAGVGLAVLAALLRLRGAAFASAAAALVTAQSLSAIPFSRTLGPGVVEKPVPAIPVSAEPPGPRMLHPYFHELRRYANLDGFQADAYLERVMLAPSHNVPRGIDDIGGSATLWSRRYAVLRTRGIRYVNDARRFATTHVVLQSPWDERTAVLKHSATQGGRLIFERDDPDLQVWAVPHRPWAFFAEGALKVANSEEARARVTDLMARGEDGVVTVEAVGQVSIGPGRVLAVARGVEELRLEAEASSDALLVVNDAYWPGWRAWIDGRETRVLPADLLVRAVRWPAGRHELVMRYVPPEIDVGIAVSLCGAAGTLGLAFLGRRRRGASLA
ncbi:MAG TPA: hypothetical protein VLT61_01695 [Anaeromyxobacteraceae bacterium]|nr:hypothetical protein [Anaeromyxobacteraceae bacterium]